MNLEKAATRIMIFLVVALFLMVAGLVYLSLPDYVEGEIVEKYIDSDNQDYFKFVILDPDGTYQICRVTADQYYSHEVGDWFEGEVYYADDPDSWWD